MSEANQSTAPPRLDRGHDGGGSASCPACGHATRIKPLPRWLSWYELYLRKVWRQHRGCPEAAEDGATVWFEECGCQHPWHVTGT